LHFGFNANELTRKSLEVIKAGLDIGKGIGQCAVEEPDSSGVYGFVITLKDIVIFLEDHIGNHLDILTAFLKLDSKGLDGFDIDGYWPDSLVELY